MSNDFRFPASKKVYIQGSRPDIRVPMREIRLSPTTGRFGERENPPVRVYDTSGPWTDPDVETDVRKGLPRSGAGGSKGAEMWRNTREGNHNRLTTGILRSPKVPLNRTPDSSADRSGPNRGAP